MQLRLGKELTFEAYVTGEGWTEATLESCPQCEGAPRGHGSYARKLPTPGRVARFYCRPCHLTISLLPDFYASRKPGLLADIEETVAVAEQAASLEAAAEHERPAEDEHAITLAAAIKWVRRRVRAIHSVLATVIGLVPVRFEGCGPTISSFRERLRTTRVLVELREICARYLGNLPAPLGLLGPRRAEPRARWRRQQSTGPDPPPPSP